jgi:hypothetical protein
LHSPVLSLDREVTVLLPKNALPPNVSIDAPESSSTIVFHIYSHGIDEVLASLALDELLLSKSDVDFKEVIPDDTIDRAELIGLLLFVSCFDSHLAQVNIGQLQGVTIDQIST